MNYVNPSFAFSYIISLFSILFYAHCPLIDRSVSKNLIHSFEYVYIFILIIADTKRGCDEMTNVVALGVCGRREDGAAPAAGAQPSGFSFPLDLFSFPLRLSEGGACRPFVIQTIFYGAVPGVEGFSGQVASLGRTGLMGAPSFAGASLSAGWDSPPYDPVNPLFFSLSFRRSPCL